MMRTFRAVFTLIAVVSSGFAATQTPSGPPQDHYAGREEWQRVPDIFAAMDVRSGSIVADLGAGGGFFTARLATAVGSTGRVFAVDINPSAVTRLKEAATAAGLTNVTVVQSQPDDPQLQEASLDAMLIVNAYHEMTGYKVLLPRLHRALRPGGRLVIVDNRPSPGDQAKGQQTGHPSLALDVAIVQLKDTGFEIAQTNPEFTRHTDQRGVERVEWMLVARK